MRLFVARLTACLTLLLCAATAFAQSGKTELLWLGQAAFRLTTREAEVLYWVIKGQIAARQPIVDLRPAVKNGHPSCAIAKASSTRAA